MKRNNRYAVVTMLGLATAAQNAMGGLDTERLKVAQGIALETFRQATGETAYTNIVAFSIEKNIQETIGKVKITYKEEGVKKEVSYSCHEHGTEIDCH